MVHMIFFVWAFFLHGETHAPILILFIWFTWRNWSWIPD